jgi:senataxin
MLVRPSVHFPERLLNSCPDFELVLKALISLFRRLGRRFWDHEDASFPQFIFDAVKDNPQYTQLLSRTTTDSWHLAWFSDYLETFWDLPTWGDVLAKTLNLLCGEAQHERFHEVRSTVVAVAADVSMCTSLFVHSV